MLIIWGISVYNGLVKAQVGVEQEWSNVETQYQHRADLIGNLVATVKGYEISMKGEAVGSFAFGVKKGVGCSFASFPNKVSTSFCERCTCLFDNPISTL